VVEALLKSTEPSSDYTAIQSVQPSARDLLACILIIIAGLLALWPYLFSGASLYWGDIELYFAPMQQFLRGCLGHGLIPLWNPYIMCGQPFVGDPQTFGLYPATFFASTCSAWRFLTVDAVIHLLLGGLFAYLLARDQARSRAASVLASLSFMLGGYFIAKIQFPNMTQAIAYVPAIVWQCGRLGRAPSSASAVLLGVLVGLQLLAAHVQIAVMTVYLAAAYAVFTAWPRLRTGRFEFIRTLGWAAVAALLACGIASGQLLPDIETWKNADHQALTIVTANRFFLQPGGQIGFIYPYSYGAPYFGNFSQLGNFWETACYLGIAPCLLALVGIFDGVRRRAAVPCFWTVMFILSVWLAEGRFGGLYTIAFYVAPGLRPFHDPARMLLGASIAAPLLAAFGFDRLMASRKQAVRLAAAAIILTATTVDLGAFDRHVYPLKPTTTLEAAVSESRSTPALALPGHRIVFPPDNRETWLYFVDYSNYRRADASYLTALFETHTSNLSMFDGILDAGGYEPEPPASAAARFVRAYNEAERHSFADADELCVDTAISINSRGSSPEPGFLGRHTISVIRNPDATRITRARLSDGRYLPVEDIDPDRAAVEIPALSSSESLTLADTDAPGWRAFSANGPIAIARTSDGLRRVELPSGSPAETVIFRYEPNSWRLGLFLSLISLGLAFGYGLHAVLSKDGKSSQ
jgi:hypothetical protein